MEPSGIKEKRKERAKTAKIGETTKLEIYSKII